ncbi:MAG TPA: hypothetical protein VGV69_08400 [Solirubrobacterales bacterium]|nr:hypothetical protein [Solirubrobacterales bacterium]
MKAILRDASDFRTHRQTVTANPDTFHIPKYHIAVPLGEPPTPDSTQYYDTACGRPADETSVEDPANVIERRRCQRPGCRQGWAALDKEAG